MKTIQSIIHALTILSFISLLLVACSDGSDSSDGLSSSTGSGTVGVLLTDAPADPDLFLEINVAIESIELLGGNDNNREKIYSGPTQVINLLDLKNESMPFSFQEGVPAGDYCKIRLTLSDLELVLVDETPNDQSDNETYHPKLPGNKKLDLNIRDCFTVTSGEMLVLQLDMDAGRSIHITENKKGYQFRPVVFVDALVADFDPKLLRLTGQLIEYDETLNTLLICDALPTTGLNNNGCVQVQLNDNTAFFDNILYTGTPRSTDELFDEDKLDSEFTIVGWPQFLAPEHVDIDIPEGHFPPQGECKLWDIQKEPGQQSAPIDCDDVPEDIPENVVVVDHDGLILDPNHPVIVVDALVIEQGEFLQIEGQALADADMVGVAIETASGPVVAESLNVTFQDDEADVNGTRFISKTGDLLDYTSVLENTSLQVDGVLEVLSETESILKAALVIIDVEGVSDDSASGMVNTVNEDSVLITLDNEQVCGMTLSQLELDLSDTFDLMTVTITDETSEIDPDGSFEVGQDIGINGSCNGSVFEVESVVIIDDMRSEA